MNCNKILPKLNLFLVLVIAVLLFHNAVLAGPSSKQFSAAMRVLLKSDIDSGGKSMAELLKNADDETAEGLINLVKLSKKTSTDSAQTFFGPRALPENHVPRVMRVGWWLWIVSLCRL